VRGQQLLLALSRAAQAVQRARTTEEVFRTVGEEISNLGYHTGVFNLTEDRKYLEANYMSFAKKSIRTAEKLTGISGKDYRFPIVEGGFFEKIIADGETVFKEQGVDLIFEALPKVSRPLAGKVGEILGIQNVIFTPLTSGGETQGLLYVIGSDLSEADTVTVSTFANQTTIALESIMLFEQVLHGRERLQKLSRQLVVAQEEERRHIARELHDEIGQLLTGLKLTWEMSKQQKPKEAKVSRQEASDIIDELMVRVRDLSLDLLPAMLDDLGLIPTLEWHFERYSNQTNVQIEFEHSGLEEGHLSMEVKTTAYRIVQEALTNIARHAGVKEAEVKIGVEEDLLWIRVEDAGAGFDFKNAMEVSSTLGLIGMQERASSVGGRVTVKTSPRKGTRLLMELPIQGKLERRQERHR
jgi:signal transduction histidine kinase